MRDVLSALIDRLALGPVALARVISTSGATPREVGSAMAITADGEVIGSVSGGCVESAVIETAAQVVHDGVAQTDRFGIADPDGIEIGLTCGGEIEVFVERLDAEHRPLLLRLRAAVETERPIAWATTLGGSPQWHLTDGTTEQQPWFRLADDVADLLRTGRSGIIGVDDCDDPAISSGTSRPRSFVQSFAPSNRLILVGANDFVRALGALGTDLGYRVTVVDARPVFATRARFPQVDEVVVDWPDRYLRHQIAAGLVDESTCICVMTHDTKFDVPTLAVALNTPDLGFIGALGSRRTVADRNARLLEAGLRPELLGRLRSPLGLDIGGHTPAEVAVSIAAQLIADRHGAGGRSLTEGSGPIHRAERSPA